MSHSVSEIVDAVAASVLERVGPSGVKVFTHRRLSLAGDQDQLPAVSVDYGEDRRLDSQFVSMIDSVLSVMTTAVAEAEDEPSLRTKLLDLRAEIHKAVMADQRQGLEFVVTTSYGGADAPEIAADAELLIGTLTSTWLVHYRMELAG